MFSSPLRLVRQRVPAPSAPLPTGRMLSLPGRGDTFVTDTPGPRPDSPAILLLHALGCTGLLTWFPSIPALAQRWRVVTLDQRWHGRGIKSPEFTLYDCADDAAALIDELGLGPTVVAGYSMGSVVAQRVWRQHPGSVSGLVLGATTDHFRGTASERLFHLALAPQMAGLRHRPPTLRGLEPLPDQPAPSPGSGDLRDWALAEFRSTSPWAVGQAVAALGRHNSRPWLGGVDVPTAVIVTAQDRVVPPERQRAVAHRIPGATTHEIPAGHASVVLGAEVFVPALVEACATVVARAQDRTGERRTGER